MYNGKKLGTENVSITTKRLQLIKTNRNSFGKKKPENVFFFLKSNYCDLKTKLVYVKLLQNYMCEINLITNEQGKRTL